MQPITGRSHPRVATRLLPAALRYPLFRRYWLGMLASVGGYRMFQFAQFWLAHELTGSALFLGFVGLTDALTAIGLTLIGGAVADRVDKKRLVIWTEAFAAVLIGGLGLIVVTGGVEYWHVLVATAGVAGIGAFNQPAKLALFPGYVGREVLMGAVALNSAVWQVTRIIAPALAGGIIAVTGTGVALYASAAGMLGMALVMRTLPEVASSADRSQRAARSVIEGLQFIRRNGLFLFLLGMTFFNGFFGLAYIPLMPIFAVDILGVGAGGQGVLLSAGGVGSLLVTTWLAMRSSNRGKGVLLLGGAILTGASLVAFSLASRYIGSFNLSLVLLFAVGAFTSMYMISVATSLQLMVPDRLRGRVMGFWALAWNFMPLGAMFAGGLGEVITVPWAVAIGGFAIVGFAVGPAMLNQQVRRLGSLVEEMAPARQTDEGPPASSARAGPPT